ncbi:hypothetical protein [Microscilla marina]|uniref:Uncharacterized protein n=1 Tax=Microscilla marina ATCC 23134 TaxID=313606 RepID=A1ZLE8_MICM2|nr:hypothetical protein [Microscilla marina]EAY28702.1 hypothetical protein M23134_07800 [Microscilla marina ATCC 23134]
MKPIHILFIIAFGIAGALSFFELSKQPPIQHVTEVFGTYTDTSKLPKNYKLFHVNKDILPHLRWRMFEGFLAGLIYGFLMMRYLLWAIYKRGINKGVDK